MSTVVEFKNITKKFNIYQNKTLSIKEKTVNSILGKHKPIVSEHYVLRNASFKIEEGSTWGIIGENGTGKSTTLKIIAKILAPNEGECDVKGKVSALLEVGAGFQADLTGKENVYLYGSILGMKKDEIDAQYKEIVEFSEMEEFMDTAVKNYSSGMYMRLAFAVAINVNPDILVIDEVLAVGDEAFQKKCINKILDFKKRGKTIIFVSHDMGMIRKICDRVIFIKKGGEILEGTPEQMVGKYLKYLYDKTSCTGSAIQEENSQEYEETDDSIQMFSSHQSQEYLEGNRFGNRLLEITNVYFSKQDGTITNGFYTGETIKINIEYKRNKPIKDLVIGIAISSEEGWQLSGPNCKQDGIVITDIQERNYASILIKRNPFTQGKYYFTIALYDEECITPYDVRDKHYWFYIEESQIYYPGKIRLECEWNI